MVVLQTWDIRIDHIDPTPPPEWPLAQRGEFFAIMSLGMFFPNDLAATGFLVPALRKLGELRHGLPALAAILVMGLLGTGVGYCVVQAFASISTGSPHASVELECSWRDGGSYLCEQYDGDFEWRCAPERAEVAGVPRDLLRCESASPVGWGPPGSPVPSYFRFPIRFAASGSVHQVAQLSYGDRAYVTLSASAHYDPVRQRWMPDPPRQSPRRTRRPAPDRRE